MSIRGVSIAFRADASLELGLGHLARCLALADALGHAGAHCHFLTQSPDDLIKPILAAGHEVHRLEHAPDRGGAVFRVAEREDAAASRSALERAPSALLVVDHYALASCWETSVRPLTQHILVIDDLASRSHDCDLLLDPNFGRTAEDYRPWVPASCEVLAGAEFAPLRAEFRAWREQSLERRSPYRLRHLFVSMGGIDATNTTSAVLESLEDDSLPPDGRISVALGVRAPWIAAVQARARRLRWHTDIIIDPPSMARLMAESDVAVGAAGGTAWERCCMGLPTLAVAVADNQRAGLRALVRAGAALDLGAPESIGSSLPVAMRQLDGKRLGEMSRAASRLVDGLGCERVVQRIERLLNHE